MSTKPEMKNLSLVPSVDSILQTEGAAALIGELGRKRALAHVQKVTREIRSEMSSRSGNTSRSDIEKEIVARLTRELESANQQRMKRVLNATGIIVHTNLGRSPLSAEAADAIVAAASGYCNLEYYLETGERGRRGESAERFLAETVGAEDAVVVNNCAAAALLVLSEFAKGGEVIVSRGELVEIGGDFRIPDVLGQSGATLREVGTTNRTKLVDYERAIGENTKLILRVHPSNYRVIGFTEKPDLSELAELAHRNNLILFEDAGSGALIDLTKFGLDEPTIQSSISAGADIVAFSGDKLMGGVQAGMIVGRKNMINQLRKNPLYRALRPDKLTYVAVEATLTAFAKGIAFKKIPVLRMLATPFEELEARAKAMVKRLRKNAGDVVPEIISGSSAIGGGAAPGINLPTCLISIRHAEMSADEFLAKLRFCDPPVIARIADNRCLIDLRTVLPNDDELLIKALANVA